MDASGRRLRLVLFTTVYFVEGALLTYFSGFNALYLRSYGVSYTRIGLVGGITLIPFVLKIFIGLLSDRVSLFGMGRRKPYIVIGLALQAVAIGVLTFVSPVDQFPLYLALMVLTALGMSTYDTATDGFSIDSTAEGDRGLVQGLMVGGRALSGVVMALAMGQLSQRGQWSGIFLLMAALAVVTVPLVLSTKDAGSRRAAAQAPTRGAFRAFLDWGFFLFLVLGIVYPFALYSTNGMVNVFLNEDLGVGLGRVGVYTSVFGIGTLLGGVVGGPLMKRIGRRTSVIAALLITASATLGLAMVPSVGLAWAVVALFGIAFGYYETVYFAVGMEFCDPRIAAFTFAFIMAVGNIGIGLGQPVAGMLVDSVGFRPMFGIFAGVHVLALPVVWGVFRRKRSAISGQQIAVS